MSRILMKTGGVPSRGKKNSGTQEEWKIGVSFTSHFNSSNEKLQFQVRTERQTIEKGDNLNDLLQRFCKNNTRIYHLRRSLSGTVCICFDKGLETCWQSKLKSFDRIPFQGKTKILARRCLNSMYIIFQLCRSSLKDFELFFSSCHNFLLHCNYKCEHVQKINTELKSKTQLLTF